MLITRENYEEFFLSYADNELSDADRLMVEQWVAANPDLREEWESLSLYRVIPDTDVIFPDKQILLRNAADTGLPENSKGGGIGENNYADYFLSYIDGELNTGDRLMVEAFILSHPGKEVELEQLRRTVSHPDTTVVFPDKSVLYRKEKDRKVVVFYRWVAGVAAALLLVVSLLLLRSRPTGEPQLVKNTPSIPAPVNKKEPSAVTPATTAALYPTEGGGKQDNTLPPATRKENRAEKRQPVSTPEVIEKNTALAVEKAEPEKQHTDPATIKPESDPVVATTDQQKVNPPVAVTQVSIPREQSSFATEALLREDNEKAIAATTEPATTGKNRLRGLFRKVTRSFGKTADRDGDGKREVLIGAFQVSVN